MLRFRFFILPLLTSIILLEGCEDPKKVTIPDNLPPVARITTTVTNGFSPLTVEFSGSSSSDPENGGLSYHWDFGDGTNAKTRSIVKTFENSGNYIVKLTVTDNGGLIDTDQITITVDDPIILFPLSENAQWVYKVTSEERENGTITGYEEGTLYITVVNINRENTNTDFIDLRITGKRYYNGTLFGDYIYLSHRASQSLQVKHDESKSYYSMIDLNKSSWNNFAMFFSFFSSDIVTMKDGSATIGLGSFNGFLVKHATDNWSDTYADTRFDFTEKEFHDPEIGMIFRETSRYTNFRTCFTCPVYTGSNTIELIGYYIPQEDGSVKESGFGYNPANHYGGNIGLLSIWTAQDFGPISVYLDNEYVGQIDSYWPSGISCDQSGVLNISRPQGSYQIKATSSQYIWSGTITFTEGICDDIELHL